MLVLVAGDAMENSEMGPLESFVIVIDTAESPSAFAAVTVTCEITTPPLEVVAASATGAPIVNISAPQTVNDQSAASDFLTVEYYQS